MDVMWIMAVIVAMAIGTIIPRAVPFYLLDKKADHHIVVYLGKYLPPTIMMLLVIYCVKDVSFLVYPYGLPELICIGVVSILHLLFRHALLSIGMGTALYMVFVQMAVFG